MNDTDQLAAEAAARISGVKTRGDVIAIIKSVIKQVMESTAAHASEEWTMETVRQLWRENQAKELTDDEQWNTFFHLVADAHNATLKPAHESEQWTVKEMPNDKKLAMITCGIEIICPLIDTPDAIDIVAAHNRAAHVSEEKWTTEPVRRSNGEIWEGLAYINLPDGRGLGSMNSEQAKAVCREHNAAMKLQEANP